jgi:hypothetical protein
MNRKRRYTGKKRALLALLMQKHHCDFSFRGGLTMMKRSLSGWAVSRQVKSFLCLSRIQKMELNGAVEHEGIRSWARMSGINSSWAVQA